MTRGRRERYERLIDSPHITGQRPFEVRCNGRCGGSCMHLNRVFTENRRAWLRCAVMAALIVLVPAVALEASAQDGLPKEKPREIRASPVRPPDVPGLVILFSGK